MKALHHQKCLKQGIIPQEEENGIRDWDGDGIRRRTDINVTDIPKRE